jgi:rare lipoprotein A
MQSTHDFSEGSIVGVHPEKTASGPAPRELLGLAMVAALVAGCGANRGAHAQWPSGERGTASESVDMGFALRSEGPPGAHRAPDQVGLASWYGDSFNGKRTASGERFDPRLLTAAHKSLAFGTWVEVRRVDTGHSVRVRINDRGPYGDRRKVIDVSKAAADSLDMVGVGTTKVEVRVVPGPRG